MAKKINVEIPRSVLPHLPHDASFGLNVYNSILVVESTGEPQQIKVGTANQKVTVSIWD